MEQTEQQRKNTYEAVGMTDPAITSSTLGASPDPNFKAPEYSSPYPVGGLTPPLTATEGEGKAQKEVDRLKELNSALVGESTFRAEKEGELGISELTKTQNDLSSRLTMLKNEALAIPLQLQQESVGRGRTVGGLKPLETGALRNNAIQALSVNSLLEASRGNLTTALALADRAVKQKYDPIREEIRASRENLDLIINSPDYTRQEKNRAQQQKEIQDERQRRIDEQEDNEKEVRKIAIDAAKFGADSVTLDKINNAKTPEEAISIASSAGFATDPLDRKKKELEIKKAIQDLNDSGTTNIKLTDENIRMLAGVNLNSDDIKGIQKDISTYGIEKVLEGITDPAQKEAVRKVYGGEGTQKFLTRDYLLGLFTEAQLKASADEAGFRGFWSTWETEKENYLKYLEGVVEKYREAGNSDQEILKMMK